MYLSKNSNLIKLGNVIGGGGGVPEQCQGRGGTGGKSKITQG